MSGEGFTPEAQERIDATVREAGDRFWEQVAVDFPEAKTGDLGPESVFAFDEVTRAVVSAWVRFNVPGAYVED